MVDQPGDASPDYDVSARFDTGVAHPARVYDYWLGGKDNFAADREAAEQVIAVRPRIRADVRANRAFLGRAVRYLTAEAGIRQFLDIGTGLPSADNTHEVAQAVAPEARVVYTDNDRCKSGCAHAGVSPSLRSRGAVRLSLRLVPSSPSRPLRADTRGRDEGTITPPRLRRVIVRPSACVPCTRRREARGRSMDDHLQ